MADQHPHPANPHFHLTPAEVRRIIGREVRRLLNSDHPAPPYVVLDCAEDLCQDLPARYDPRRGASEKTFIQSQARFRLRTAANRCAECLHGKVSLESKLDSEFSRNGSRIEIGSGLDSISDCLPADHWEPLVALRHQLGALLDRIPEKQAAAVRSRHLYGLSEREMVELGAYRDLRNGMSRLRRIALKEGI